IGAIAELRGGDGKLIVGTDASWTSGELPIRKSGIYFGEIYDARLEGATADKGSADIAGFKMATLLPAESDPVRELPPLPVQESWADEQGRTTYDFGQNAAGYPAFTVRGSRGARVVVEFSEILDGNRNIDNANYRSADCRLEYVLKGEGTESYRPVFTFFGYRYARVTIADGEATVLSIVSVPISSAQHVTASFSSGHPLVNRLVENTLWSLRSNFVDVPTDCPQRDERLGWTGDAQVFAPTACYLNDSEQFLRKWIRDVMADQREDGQIPHVSPDPTRLHPDKVPFFVGSTGWGDVICVMPWVLYEHYGDKSVLTETLPAMVKWVDFEWSISNGPIVQPPRAREERGATF